MGRIRTNRVLGAPRRRERGHLGLVLRPCTLAVLIVAGVASFSISAWAVDGGYGPSAGSASGGAGTFFNIIVAKTVGPSGGVVLGHVHGTTIDVLIPPGILMRDGTVEVTAIKPACNALRGQEIVAGLAVFLVNKQNTEDTLPAGAEVAIASQEITPGSVILSEEPGKCTVIHRLEILDGHVTLPIRSSSAFVIMSPSGAGRAVSDHSPAGCNPLGGEGCAPEERTLLCLFQIWDRTCRSNPYSSMPA